MIFRIPFSLGELNFLEEGAQLLIEISRLAEKISLIFKAKIQNFLEHLSPPNQVSSFFHREQHTLQVKIDLFNRLDEKHKQKLTEDSVLKDIVNAYRKQQGKTDVCEIIKSIKIKTQSFKEETVYEIIATCEAYNIKITEEKIITLTKVWENTKPAYLFHFILKKEAIEIPTSQKQQIQKEVLQQNVQESRELNEKASVEEIYAWLEREQRETSNKLSKDTLYEIVAAFDEAFIDLYSTQLYLMNDTDWKAHPHLPSCPLSLGINLSSSRAEFLEAIQD